MNIVTTDLRYQAHELGTAIDRGLVTTAEARELYLGQFQENRPIVKCDSSEVLEDLTAIVSQLRGDNAMLRQYLSSAIAHVPDQLASYSIWKAAVAAGHFGEKRFGSPTS